MTGIVGGSGSSALTVGTTVVSGGATTRVLYDNAGVVGEYTVSGTGSVAMTASPTFTGTVTLPDSTTISSSGHSAITVVGNSTLQGAVMVSGASFGLSGSISAATWTTNGVRYKNIAGTLTDTTASTGTTPTAYTDVWGGNTIAATNASVVFTNYYGSYFKAPSAGTNVTLTNSWGLGADSLNVGTSGTFKVSTAGVLTTAGAQLTTPTLGVFTATSGAFGGATIGSDVIAATGSMTLSGAISHGTEINTGNGAASVAQVLWNGTVFTGGSATTTFPAMFVQPSGTTAVTSWSTSGTGLGMNLASGFAGNFLDFRVAGGGVVFQVNSAGALTTASNITMGGSGSFTLTNTAAQIALRNSATFISSSAPATIKFGQADVASAAVAQTVTFQGNTGSTTDGPVALIRGAGGGSSTSVGGELRLSGGLSSAAAGTGGAVTIYTAPAASGNAAVLVATFDSTKLLTLAGSISIAGNITYTAAASGPILKQGANGRCGTFVANGATPVTVNNTSVAITDTIMISLNTVGGTGPVIQPFVATITASSGFTTAANTGDTSTYNYVIIKNAA